MAKLGVNIDHIATVREARKTNEPDPVFAAMLAEQAGCHCITCHLREDRRHINERDLSILREVVKTKLNLEMAVNKEILNIAVKTKVNQATLVPEKRQEVTTEGGLDVIKGYEKISEAINVLNNNKIEVSLFIDPDSEQIKYTKKAGANIIELHTGSFANAKTKQIKNEEYKKIITATELAMSLDMTVNMGHGLTYHNIHPLACIKKINEFNIGHSVISRAVFTGMEKAVKDMLDILKECNKKNKSQAV